VRFMQPSSVREFSIAISEHRAPLHRGRFEQVVRTLPCAMSGGDLELVLDVEAHDVRNRDGEFPYARGLHERTDVLECLQSDFEALLRLWLSAAAPTAKRQNRRSQAARAHQQGGHLPKGKMPLGPRMSRMSSAEAGVSVCVGLVLELVLAGAAVDVNAAGAGAGAVGWMQSWPSLWPAPWIGCRRDRDHWRGNRQRGDERDRRCGECMGRSVVHAPAHTRRRSRVLKNRCRAGM